jgi:hypothetical protein
MKVFKELPKKSKELEKLNLTGLQLEFHGSDSFDNVRRLNKYENTVFSAFFNELQDVNYIEIKGRIYQVCRDGYEDILRLVPLR